MLGTALLAYSVYIFGVNILIYKTRKYSGDPALQLYSFKIAWVWVTAGWNLSLYNAAFSKLSSD
jgi:hypothetical protein